MVFKVSHSKIKTWRKCRRAYHNKYVLRLRRRRKSRPLVFGDMLHQCLDVWKEGDDAFEKLDELGASQGKLFRREVELYGDIVEDMRCILTEYFEHWENDDLVWMRINRKSAEHGFEIEISPGIILTGKIDGLAKRRRLRWLVEHKSFGKQIPEESKRWKNLQSIVYHRVVEMLGWAELDGTLWDFIGSKPPGRPQLLKSGELSKKKLITLPTRVIETIKENGLKTKDYKSLIDNAHRCRDHYFQRIQNTVKKETVDMAFEDLVATAREMEKMHGKVRDMNIDFHCDQCDYEPLCSARLRGLDVDYVMEREYEISKSKKK